MINGRNVFNQPIKYDKMTCDNNRKVAAGQGDDYKTGCLLAYICLKKNYKLIAIDLSRQQKLDADPKALQQINFTGNFEQEENRQMFFIADQTKETVLDFSKGTVKVLWFYFVLI